MAYENLRNESLNYEICSYPDSKLWFRGPQRDLLGKYVAFLGGTETFGKFIEAPFPSLVEKSLDITCVNLGWSNAGVDVFLNDAGVLNVAQKARHVVLQLPCAQNMTNRYYSVHPRRNDRFLQPSASMREMFPEVDFTHYNFTRHLLSHLRQNMPQRFRVLRKELQAVWVSRMRLLVDQINSDLTLLWFSKRRPGEYYDSPELSLEPALVTRRMIQAISNDDVHVVEVCASPEACAAGTLGMVFTELEATAAVELMGPAAHAEAAQALVPALRNSLA